MAQAAQRSADPKHNVTGARQAYYDRISKFNMAPLWEKLRQLVGNEPKTQCAPAIWRFADVKGDGDGVGRPHLRQGGRAAGAGAGESGAARPVAHHPVALCGVAADHARRGRAGPSPHSVRHPLHPRRRRRLYRGRGRAHLHVAGRFRAHPQLGLSRPRQHLGPADDLARRARSADHQFLRVDVLRASRRGNAAGRPCRRQFARLLRLRRVAGRRAGDAQAQPGDQLHLCAHAADRGAAA